MRDLPRIVGAPMAAGSLTVAPATITYFTTPTPKRRLFDKGYRPTTSITKKWASRRRCLGQRKPE